MTPPGADGHDRRATDGSTRDRTAVPTSAPAAVPRNAPPQSSATVRPRPPPSEPPASTSSHHNGFAIADACAMFLGIPLRRVVVGGRGQGESSGTPGIALAFQDDVYPSGAVVSSVDPGAIASGTLRVGE